MANTNFNNAKAAKNDEFYTQYHDIEKEINSYLDLNPELFKDKIVLLPCDDPEWSNFTKYFAQNFEKIGLKKLISTSYAPDSKSTSPDRQPTLFELESPKYDAEKSASRGRILTLERDINGDKRVDVEDLEWDYLEGDGDFRSSEISQLRDSSDFIITNPPFSLFRDFLAWVLEANKRFLLLGNLNAITYKEVFPIIKDNRMWLGATGYSTDMVFRVPPEAIVASHDREKAAKMGYVGDYTRMGNSCWYTNLDHGRRHTFLPLMNMADNVKFSKHKEIKNIGYKKFDNFDAIEVPFVDAIPAEYRDVMGVPVSFLDKYNPDQFELIGLSGNGLMPESLKIYPHEKHDRPYLEGKRMYVRLFIRAKG